MMTFLPLLFMACGHIDAPGEPLVEAHRAGAGYWPENSRRAIDGSLQAGFDVMELDVQLTNDGVPVLWHGPFLENERCTDADFRALPEPVSIKNATWADLRDGYLCGGLPDEDHPNAELLHAPLITFDELIERLEDFPDVTLHVDVMPREEAAHEDKFADAIVSRWLAADLPNDWFVSANTGKVLNSFQRRAREDGVEVETCLIHSTPGQTSAQNGLYDYVGLALEAGSDCIVIDYEIADRHAVEDAWVNYIDVLLWTLNDPNALRKHMNWPVRAVITDYPGDVQ
jgi:glycerophosphoryl diester phosphodiesterase